MIENVFAVLCRRAIDDKSSHNLSLIETFSKLTTTVHPSVVEDTFGIHFEFVWASLWANTGNEKLGGTVKGFVQSPDGRQVELGEMTLDVPPGETSKIRVNVQGIELSGPGWYRFILRLKQDGAQRYVRAATNHLRVVYNVEEDAEMIEIPRQME